MECIFVNIYYLTIYRILGTYRDVYIYTNTNSLIYNIYILM